MPAVGHATIERKNQSDWQAEHIAGFWDWCSQSPLRQRSYFTAQVGPGIRGFLERHVRLRGRLLDFGCGTGHLLDILLRNSKQLDGYGLEFSRESAEAVEERLSGAANWRGVVQLKGFPTPFPDAHFQIITLIETIEHLKDDALDATLRELHRVLAPGGRLLVTTPFEEDLEANMIYCPFCRSEFHRMQHMRSFSRASLCRVLEDIQFDVLYCRNINFRHYGARSDRLFRAAKGGGKRWLKTFLGRSSSPPPHLVALVTK